MLAYLLYAAAAMCLGVLTSISPCPLTTNIAAISYIGRKVGNPSSVMAAGLLYTVGRCVLYLGVAALLAATALSLPAVDLFLQKYVHLVLGPIFLVLGMLLAGLITADFGGTAMTAAMQQRIDTMGLWGALPLGALFAASFCPISAGLFFGLLALLLGMESAMVVSTLARFGIYLPETIPAGGVLMMPVIYGVGTALPVLIVAFLLAYYANAVGKAYAVLAKTDRWARLITGWLFIGIGVYFSLAYVLTATP